jgi:ABC-type multidrug transport system ATPase subunit
VTTLSFDLVSQRELSRVSAAFASGTHVVLGTEHDGTGTLIELAAGIARPAAGRVTLDGQEPYSNASVRRRVAALCAVERLPPARTVAIAMNTALRARSDARSAVTVLDSAGLSHFAAHRTADLSPRENRALGLVLALSHPDPILLALFEPFALLGILSEDFVREGLARFGSSAVVLTTASRIEDATRLGGTTSALERGTWLDSAAARVPLSQITLRVLTPEPRRLAARLAEAPDVSAVEWAGGHELLVRGADLERVAAHVVASARSEAIRIEALRYDPPSLDALAAARAGLAQASYEREHAPSNAAPPTSNAQPIVAPPGAPR